MDAPESTLSVPEQVIEQAIVASRKIAHDPARGAFAVSVDEIVAMAHMVALFDPPQHDYLARVYGSTDTPGAGDREGLS